MPFQNKTLHKGGYLKIDGAESEKREFLYREVFSVKCFAAAPKSTNRIEIIEFLWLCCGSNSALTQHQTCTKIFLGKMRGLFVRE